MRLRGTFTGAGAATQSVSAFTESHPVCKPTWFCDLPKCSPGFCVHVAAYPAGYLAEQISKPLQLLVCSWSGCYGTLMKSEMYVDPRSSFCLLWHCHCPLAACGTQVHPSKPCTTEGLSKEMTGLLTWETASYPCQRQMHFHRYIGLIGKELVMFIHLPVVKIFDHFKPCVLQTAFEEVEYDVNTLSFPFLTKRQHLKSWSSPAEAPGSLIIPELCKRCCITFSITELWNHPGQKRPSRTPVQPPAWFRTIES